MTTQRHTCFDVRCNGLRYWPSIVDNFSHLSPHCTGAKVSVRSSRQAPKYELVRTVASEIQRYRVWPVLQIEDAWIRRHPGGPKPCVSKSANARIRVDLNANAMLPPVLMYPSSMRPATHPVRFLISLDDMLPQFLRVMDPRFRLEERFFLRIQFQRSAIGADSPEVLSGFTV